MECGICLGDYDHGDLICKSIHHTSNCNSSLSSEHDRCQTAATVTTTELFNINDNEDGSSDDSKVQLALKPTSTSDICTHVFHLDCIMEWLMKQRAKGKCPLCRRTFVSMDGLEEQYQGSSRSTRNRWMRRRNRTRNIIGNNMQRQGNRIDSIHEEENDALNELDQEDYNDDNDIEHRSENFQADNGENNFDTTTSNNERSDIEHLSSYEC